MRWKRLLVAVAASGWFFPVSCTTSLYAGVRVVSAIDARDVSDGESLHSQFSYVIETGNDDEPVAVGDLYSLARYQEARQVSEAPTQSFLMSRPSGQRDLDDSGFSYRVIEDDGSEQIIEVVEAYHDGDNTIWSRYKATRSSISPISSRMFYFGYMFTAYPFALGFAFLIYGIGRFLKRKGQTTFAIK